MRTLLKKLAKIKKDVIFEEFFYRSSYHHTSKMFNSTDFYALNEDHVEDISDDLIQMQTDKSAKDGKKKLTSGKYFMHGLIRRHHFGVFFF